MRGVAEVFVAEPTAETVARMRALIRARRPFVPLHPRLTAAERDALRPDLAAIPDGTLAVLYTSGTSGRPKGAILSRAAFIASARASAARLGWRDDDRWLCSLPLAHVGGLSVLVRCLLARRPFVLGRGDRVAEDLLAHRATIVSLVPAQLARLLDGAWTPPRWLRLVLLGGAAAPPRLLARAAAAGVPVVTTYGLTEACSQVATQVPGRPGAGCGPPLPGIAVRIADGDRIEIDGPTLFSGYLGEPPRAPGWFATGDFGRFDAAGNLHVLGRRTDLIVTGGENVYAAEVEAYLDARGVPACVFGVPDETWGEIVAAATTAPLPTAALADLAPFKRPRRIARVEALPLTPGGKPDRAAARALAERAGLVPLG
ncbi:MAG TPA: AMP-binding protein [Haliangiales bacterium]|nr:AMP-binding protein [Haliangiales bacterium]